MVKISLFAGLHASPPIAHEIASKPYDVVTREEAARLSNQKQASFVLKQYTLKHSYYHVIRPEISLPADVKEDDESVYKLGRENLNKFIEKGYLKQDDNERLYVYDITYKNIKSIGIFLLARVEDYQKKVIKRHELTRQDKEIDRTNLINIQNANAEPILFTYHDVKTINDLLEQIQKTQPLIDIVTEDDKAMHKIWQLSPEDSRFIQSEFSREVSCFYIADGHHRMAASFNVAQQRRQLAEKQGVALTGEEPFEYVFALAISLRNLHIMPYNRVINSFKGASEDQILEQIKQSFDIEKAGKDEEVVPKQKGEWSMLIKNEWHKLKVKEEQKNQVLGQTPSKAEILDVNLLQHLMIEPVFGIKNIRTDKNIEFVGGVSPRRSLEEKYFQEKKACSILCHPVSVQELLDISDHNQIMMPKSTWVIPKPRSGLIVRHF